MRQARAIASQVERYRHRVAAFDHVRENRPNDGAAGQVAVGVAQPGLITAMCLDQDQRRRIPLRGAVRLGPIRRHRVGGHLETLDPDVVLDDGRH